MVTPLSTFLTSTACRRCPSSGHAAHRPSCPCPSAAHHAHAHRTSRRPSHPHARRRARALGSGRVVMSLRPWARARSGQRPRHRLRSRVRPAHPGQQCPFHGLLSFFRMSVTRRRAPILDPLAQSGEHPRLELPRALTADGQAPADLGKPRRLFAQRAHLPGSCRRARRSSSGRRRRPRARAPGIRVVRTGHPAGSSSSSGRSPAGCSPRDPSRRRARDAPGASNDTSFPGSVRSKKRRRPSRVDVWRTIRLVSIR